MRPAKTQITQVWSEPSLCAQWVVKDLSFLHADSDNWVNAQADLSLCWAHMPFCWFCHEVAHILYAMDVLSMDLWHFPQLSGLPWWSQVFGQTGLSKQCRPRSNCSTRSSLIWVYTVCHSVCNFWTHYSMVKPHCANFPIITAHVLVSDFFIFLPYTIKILKFRTVENLL